MKINTAVLKKLDRSRQDRDTGAAQRVEALLRSLRKPQFTNAKSLIDVHDTLLFLRAFPQSERVAQLADGLLNSLEPEVHRLSVKAKDADLFEEEQYSGIAGTSFEEEHTYEVARWLARLYPDKISADWDFDDQYAKLVNTLPRFMPLLEDDTFVEPDIPFDRWLANAAGSKGHEWLWLIEQFENSGLSIKDRTELYDSLGIYLKFNLSGSKASRTYARRPVTKLFIHDGPLIRRNQVSLAKEFASDPIPLRKLEEKEPEELLQQAREALTVRRRELYGTTRADARYVYEANVGRGVLIYLWGLPPDRRLPLRAYHAGCTYKNGVPINYLESISLFGWAEVGFNTFYAYREGETAWIYSKVLHLLHQVSGVSCFSVYPYQIGFENEEAIQSGAFWFYRKLGFRPGKPELLKLAEREEQKIAKSPKYRTTAATLRRLADGHIFYELGNAPRGLYDNFSVRKIGLAVQKHMDETYEGNARRMKGAVTTELAKTLGTDLKRLSHGELSAFTDFACALSLVPDVRQWSEDERHRLGDVIRAKSGAEESVYLRLLQQHEPLKQALVKIGSTNP